MLIGMKHIRRIPLQSAFWRLFGIFADGAVEDIWELWGNFVESVRTYAKVLGQYLLWSM